MLDQREFIPVAEGLIARNGGRSPSSSARAAADAPRSRSRARRPARAAPPRRYEERRLQRRGTLWTWTIQCFPPKSPPYAVEPGDDFEPYGVGYVELPGEVRVEARLTEADPARLRIGMPMELTLIPAPGDSGTTTFAFRPVEDDEEADR